MSTDNLGSASPHCKAPNLPSPVDEVAWLSGRHCTRCCLYRLLVQASDAGLGLPLSVCGERNGNRARPASGAMSQLEAEAIARLRPCRYDTNM